MKENSPQDDNRIDDLIGRAIDTRRPEFDEEAFSVRFADELATLRARAHQHEPAAMEATPYLLKYRKTILAAAAVIIVAVSLLFVARGPEPPGGDPRKSEALIPAEMVTGQALRTAYRQGGMEALEAQFDKAIELLGPRPANLSIQELYDNGNS